MTNGSKKSLDFILRIYPHRIYLFEFFAISYQQEKLLCEIFLRNRISFIRICVRCCIRFGILMTIYFGARRKYIFSVCVSFLQYRLFENIRNKMSHRKCRKKEIHNFSHFDSCLEQWCTELTWRVCVCCVIVLSLKIISNRFALNMNCVTKMEKEWE